VRGIRLWCRGVDVTIAGYSQLEGGRLSDSRPPEFDPTIADFYHLTPEEDRLKHGPFLLEAIRTRELIQRFAPPAPAAVVDIGGAAGAYALWLAEAGYTVHLLDAVPRLVVEARRRSLLQTRSLASCDVGDARATKFADGTADIVLLLGPLYHLTTATDRARAFGEAARVLKPGGRLLAAAISRWASALDGLVRDLFSDLRFAAIVQRDLHDGQHRNPTDRLDDFTTAYFHRPEDFRQEALDAGLFVDGVFGIEGPGWFLSDLGARPSDERCRADLLHVARIFESEPSVVGVSAHLLLVGRKPLTALTTADTSGEA
jgi:SAM-dependent methyltransferase